MIYIWAVGNICYTTNALCVKLSIISKRVKKTQQKVLNDYFHDVQKVIYIDNVHYYVNNISRLSKLMFFFSKKKTYKNSVDLKRLTELVKAS